MKQSLSLTLIVTGQRLALVLALSLVASACSAAAPLAPSDPGGVGLAAVCGAQASIAKNKTDWGILSSTSSEFEDALAAADRLQRSYEQGSASLGTISTSNSLYPSGQFLKASMDKLAKVFNHFKHAAVYQSKTEQDAALAEYAAVFNALTSDVTNGNIPGREAFNTLVGFTYSSCLGVATSYSPAVSTISIDTPQNRNVCKAESALYSLDDVLVDLAAIEWNSLVLGSAESFAPIQNLGSKMQPALMDSSGSLLFGMARAFSGFMSLYAVGIAGDSAAIAPASDVAADGLKLSMAACREIGIELAQ